MPVKRCFDCITAAAGLFFAGPLLFFIALVIRLTSDGPIFFRQVRIGLEGREFRLCKFRTMQVARGAETGSFDAGNTSRVTALGRFLRKSKLDELPQLWNVLAGDMSLVGPRPEVRRWVEAYPERWARVLTVRPGITDPASIAYRNEEEILAKSADPERIYRDEILPHKLSLYESYVQNQTFWGDMKILFMTLLVVAGKDEERKTSYGL
jgi:lipopolysaccharide/colanic/teichoic acid biosynthesis glycosyltransferase